MKFAVEIASFRGIYRDGGIFCFLPSASRFSSSKLILSLPARSGREHPSLPALRIHGRGQQNHREIRARMGPFRGGLFRAQ